MYPKLIIYDKDGTLVPTKEIYCSMEDQVLIEMGAKSRPWHVYLTHPLRVVDWHGYYRDLGVDASRTQDAIDLFFRKEADLKTIPVIDGVFEALDEIEHMGINQHLLTHNHHESIVRRKLVMTGLNRLFPEGRFTIAHDGKYEHFAGICKIYAAAPDETMFLTDIRADIDDGNRAGLFTIAVSNEHSYDAHSELVKANPRRIITDIRELTEIVRAIL